MESTPTSTNALATAQAITIAPKAPENVPTRIKKLETAIFAAQRALLSSSEDQITQIRKISEELPLPTGRSFATPKEHLTSILSTLKERVGEMKRKFNKRAAHPLALQVEEPNGLSNLDCGLLQNIVQFCDTDTIRNLALTSRSLSLKIHQLHGQTVEQNGKDETKFFLLRIYNKEEALAKLRSSQSSIAKAYVYTHCIKELQRDEDIQITYLNKSYNGFWNIPKPEEKNEDMEYLHQYNQLKIKVFLSSETNEREQMILNENGTNTPLKNLIRKIAEPGMTLEEAMDTIPKSLFQNIFESPHFCKTIALRFPNDPEILTLCGPLFRHAPLTMRNNKKIVLQAVKMNGLSLEDASNALKNDPDIVLAAVKCDGDALEFASDELKKDPKIVLAAVQDAGYSLDFASDELKKDPKIVLAAVQNDGDALEFASDELKKDPKIVLAAVQNDGGALEYASDALKNDPTIVLAAVQNDDKALEYASDALKNDPAIVLAAVKNYGGALEFASDELKKDPAFVLAAVKKNGYALEFASDALKNDPAIVLAAVKKNSYTLEFASDALKNDPAFVLAAVQSDGYALRFASDELRNNRDIVLTALHNTPAKELFINKKLLRDPEIRAVIEAQSDDSSSYSSESTTDSSSFSSETSVNSDHSTKFHSLKKKKSETRLERITRLVKKETQARQHLLKNARVERPTYVQPHQTEHKRKHDHFHNYR